MDAESSALQDWAFAILAVMWLVGIVALTVYEFRTLRRPK